MKVNPVTVQMGVKLKFLIMGFKNYEVFKNLCNELGEFYPMELYMFWHLGIYSSNTLDKIEGVIEKLKNE